MNAIQQYGRWHHEFAAGSKVTAVIFTQAGGSRVERPVFQHQPTRLVYECHGYESIEPIGDVVPAVRFTPDQAGACSWQAVDADGVVVEEGALDVEAAEHPGYVGVSDRDSRYFVFSDGSSYCPIGINLCWPVYYRKSKGTEFETTEDRTTMGLADFRRWFEAMAAAGGNFTRIWCSSPALNVETETAAVLDLAAFARLDAIIELARTHGIRLKLCLEHFRHVDAGSPYHTFRQTHPAFCKEIHDPAGGPAPADIAEWFESPRWRELWLQKVDAYTARYGDDPTVMCWELWNEINACRTGDWSIPRAWTRAMLPELKKRSPRNLVVNSLGSFDSDNKVSQHHDFHMDEMEFQQVHRYLDQGARLEICHTDPVALSIDAVQRARRPDRPILLAETGAVNDNHTGQFRFYRVDHDGLLLHDFVFAPFFAGAAGSGHSWFWEHYVEPHNLWHHLAPMRAFVNGLQLDAEDFEPHDLSTDDAWILALAGRQHVLLWVRSRADRWDRVLRDHTPAPVVDGMTVDFSSLKIAAGGGNWIQTWPAEPMPTADPAVSDGKLKLPAFVHGLGVRLRR